MPTETTMHVRILNWKPFAKNTLRGFFDIAFANGMIVRGLTLHERGGGRWIGLPSRKFVKDGEESYARIVDFVDRDSLDKFRDRVLAALDAGQAESRTSQSPSQASTGKSSGRYQATDHDIPEFLR